MVDDFFCGRFELFGDGGEDSKEALDVFRGRRSERREYLDISDGGAKCKGPSGDASAVKDDMEEDSAMKRTAKGLIRRRGGELPGIYILHSYSLRSSSALT